MYLIGACSLSFSGKTGEPVTQVTDGSSVAFVVSKEVMVMISNAIATGGEVIPPFFNNTNKGIDITIPLPNDESIINSSITILSKVSLLSTYTRFVSFIRRTLSLAPYYIFLGAHALPAFLSTHHASLAFSL